MRAVGARARLVDSDPGVCRQRIREFPGPPSAVSYGMALSGARLNVLLICPWQIDLRELRDTISAAGYTAVVRRVDFAAAIRAALVASRFDLAAYVPTPGLKRDAVQSILREHPALMLVSADTLTELGREIVCTLEQRSS
jgi:hypothetical protein